MNKRHYEHTLPNIRGSLSNTYVLTNGVSHKSSFIGPAVWGFASKIKSIYALSLVQPFTAPTFYAP